MTESHDSDATHEPPTQGVFIGWLALVLLIFALCVGAFGLIAGATHGFS